jgi:hypothetical protein
MKKNIAKLRLLKDKWQTMQKNMQSLPPFLTYEKNRIKAAYISLPEEYP